MHVGSKGSVLSDSMQPDAYAKIQALEASKERRRGDREEAALTQAPVFVKQLTDIGVVAEGQNIQVEAEIEPKNDATLKVEWEANGKPISSGNCKLLIRCLLNTYLLQFRVLYMFGTTNNVCISGSRLITSMDFGHVQLNINGVRPSDSGIYTCKAINSLGQAVSTTSIKVEGTGSLQEIPG
jgi:hypothetical protein